MMLPREIWTLIFRNLDDCTLRKKASLVCKEWLNLIRYDSILSGNLIITTDKGAKDINKFLQSFPMLEAIVFKIPQATLEFMEDLNFDCCPGLKVVSVQGDTTDVLGFRISDHQTKYEFDFGFPVEVLEVEFHPKDKNHLSPQNIQKLRLHLTGYKSDTSIRNNINGGLEHLKSCCPSNLQKLDLQFGDSHQEQLDSTVINLCLTYFNSLEEIDFTKGVCDQFESICAQQEGVYPENTIKTLVFDTMKFHNENLTNIVCLFPHFEEVRIKNCNMKLGAMDFKNSRFELSDLITHLEIFSLIKNLKNLVLENIYTTNSDDPKTIDYQLKQVMKFIRSIKGFELIKVRIIIESYGYTYAEIFKEKNRPPTMIPGTKTMLMANDDHVFFLDMTDISSFF
jgi:hypothetical protein